MPDTDWHVEQLCAFAHDSGVTSLIATHSRYVIDLNRDPTGAAHAILLSLALLLVQILLGSVVVNSNLDAVVTALHLANATALFGVMVIAVVLTHVGETTAGGFFRASANV